jgi:hypothetical protein
VNYCDGHAETGTTVRYAFVICASYRGLARCWVESFHCSFFRDGQWSPSVYAGAGAVDRPDFQTITRRSVRAVRRCARESRSDDYGLTLEGVGETAMRPGEIVKVAAGLGMTVAALCEKAKV